MKKRSSQIIDEKLDTSNESQYHISSYPVLREIFDYSASHFTPILCFFRKSRQKKTQFKQLIYRQCIFLFVFIVIN